MARLEGKQPNAGAIIIGAVIFSLIAAGLFFAFRPVPEPTDAGLSNSAETTSPEGGSSDANAIEGESDNSLNTILTPLPLATPAPSPQATTDVPADNSATPLMDNSATAPTDNSAIAPADNNAMSPMATPAETPAMNSAAPPVAP